MAAELSISAPKDVPAAMESLFVPCTRYGDLRIARAEDGRDPEDQAVPNVGEEVELTAHGAQEGVLSNGAWDWTELWSFIEGKIIWFSPDVYINGAVDWRTGDYDFGRCVLNVAIESSVTGHWAHRAVSYL